MGAKSEHDMRALSGQLLAEIRAAGRSVRSVADALNVDYSTFRRQVINENPIRMVTVFDTLNVLGVSTDVFFKRVADRAAAPPTD